MYRRPESGTETRKRGFQCGWKRAKVKTSCGKVGAARCAEMLKKPLKAFLGEEEVVPAAPRGSPGVSGGVRGLWAAGLGSEPLGGCLLTAPNFQLSSHNLCFPTKRNM